jgi:hypothetical protein
VEGVRAVDYEWQDALLKSYGVLFLCINEGGRLGVIRHKVVDHDAAFSLL